MAILNLPPKPAPTAEGLPLEIWTLICLAETSNSHTVSFILGSSSLCSLARASRTIYNKTRDGFERHVYFRPKFSLTSWSIDRLVEISNDARLKTYVKELEFGPEQLNWRLEETLRHRTKKVTQAMVQWNARLEMQESTSWPVWPVVRLPNGRRKALDVQWTSADGQQDWTEKYGAAYRSACPAQYVHRDVLLDAIARLPNLRKIILDNRPVGPSYEHLLGTYIRPSIGTREIGRMIGAHEIALQSDNAPGGASWVSKFSVDGLVLVQPGKELELMSCFFCWPMTQLASEILFELVVMAVEPESPHHTDSISELRDPSGNWKLMAPRIRTVTFDLAGYNLRPDAAEHWESWVNQMLKYSSYLEHICVRNGHIPGTFASKVLRCVAAMPSTNLKVFHLSSATVEATSLITVLGKYMLSDISLHEVCLTEDLSFDWYSIFAIMEGIPRLHRVLLQHLSSVQVNTLRRKPVEAPGHQVCSWMKAEKRSAVQMLLSTATMGARYQPVAAPLPRWEILFEIPTEI